MWTGTPIAVACAVAVIAVMALGAPAPARADVVIACEDRRLITIDPSGLEALSRIDPCTGQPIAPSDAATNAHAEIVTPRIIRGSGHAGRAAARAGTSGSAASGRPADPRLRASFARREIAPQPAR